jgi:hypothetical protein
LMTQKEKAQEKINLDLENAPWFKNAFSGLDLESELGNKQQAPPPKALFNLDGKRLVKTIHECHVAKATTGIPPPKQKGKKNEDAIMVDSSEDKDSASLPSNTGPRDQTAEGVDNTSPTSSAEDGQDESAVNGGKLPSAILPCPRGRHSKRCQVVQKSPGAGPIIKGNKPQGGGAIIYVHLRLGRATNISRRSTWSTNLATGQARYKRGG